MCIPYLLVPDHDRHAACGLEAALRLVHKGRAQPEEEEAVSIYIYVHIHT